MSSLKANKKLAIVMTLLYSLQLLVMVPSSAAALDSFAATFQSNTVGTDAGTLPGWSVTPSGTSPDPAKVNTTIFADPNDATNKVVRVYDTQSNASANSILSFPTISGQNSGGVVTAEFKMALGAISKNSRVSLKQGSLTIGSVFVSTASNCGLALSAPSAAAGAGGSSTNTTLSWGMTNDNGTYLQKNKFHTIKFEMNFTTKTFAMYYNGDQKTMSAFASAGITGIDSLQITTTNDSEATIYIDDFYVTEGLDLTVAGKPSDSASSGYIWKNVPLGASGFVTGVVAHPTEADLVYCRTDVGGAYRWDEANRRWIPLNDMFGTSLNNLYGIDGMALDANNPDIIYLAAGKYTWGTCDILKSYNRGQTWQRTYFPGASYSANDGYRGMGENIAVDPNNSNILLAGSYNKGLWKSTDGGASYTKVLDVTNPIRNIVFDTATASGGATQTIYAGVVTKGLYKSTDGGNTWAAVSGSPATIKRMAVSPTSKLYLASTTGVFRYQNGTFTEISPVAGGTYNGIDISPTNENTLIVTGPHTSSNLMKIPFYQSTDGGATWTNKFNTRSVTSTLSWDTYTSGGKDFNSNGHCIIYDPTRSGRVWLSDFFGVYKTENINASPTQSWFFEYAGDEETVPRDFICPPTGPFPLIASVADIDGMVWEDVTEYPTRRIRTNRDAPWMMGSSSIDYCEENPNIVVRVGIDWNSSAKAEVSTNNTASWTNISFKKKSNPSQYYYPSQFGMVAVSSKINPATGYPSIVVIPKQHTPLVSFDLGATWEEITGVSSPTTLCADYWNKGIHIAADPIDGSKFYIQDRVGGSSKTYISTDWGKTWTAGGTATGGHDVDKTYIKTMPGAGNDVWVVVGGGSLSRSTDGGQTYTKFSNIADVECFGFGKNAPGVSNPTVYLYASVNGTKGIYRSIDLGQTWVRINDANSALGCQPKVMEGDMRQFGVVYLGTDGRGVFVGHPEGVVIDPNPVPSPSPSPTPTPTPEPTEPTYYVQRFDLPVDTEANDIPNWSASYPGNNYDPARVYAKVKQDPTNSQNNAMRFYDDVHSKADNALINGGVSFDRKTGFQGSIVSAEFKFMAGNMSKQSRITLRDGSDTIGYLFVNPSANCGLSWVAPSTSAGPGGSNSTTNLTWGVSNPDGTYMPKHQWVTLRFELDTVNQTTKVYYNNSLKVTSSFASAGAAGLDAITFGTRNDSVDDYYIDDVYVIDGTDFSIIPEPPAYVSQTFESEALDTELSELPGFTVSFDGNNFDATKIFAKVAADPTNSNNRTVRIYDDVKDHAPNANVNATLSFDQMVGDENGIVTAQLKWMPGNMSKQSRITLRDGSNVLGYAFINPSANCGMSWVAPSTSAGPGGSNTTTNLTWGMTNPDGIYMQKHTWVTLKFEIDTVNQTTKVYFNNSLKVTSSFASASAEGLSSIQFVTNNDSVADFYIDDLFVVNGTDLSIAQ